MGKAIEKLPEDSEKAAIEGHLEVHLVQIADIKSHASVASN